LTDETVFPCRRDAWAVRTAYAGYQMAKLNTGRFTLDDRAGRRIHAVWSHSGKRLGISSSEAGWHAFRQVELRPEQVGELARFIAETCAEEMRVRGRRSTRFEDAGGRRLDLTWSRSGRTLVISVFEPTHVAAGQVVLPPEQLPALVAFLSES
jgi:hypothetical protein